MIQGISKSFAGAVSLCLLLTGLLASSFAQSVGDVVTEKRGQTGMKFLAFSPDARASALAGGTTADVSAGAMSLFYNPAAMGWIDQSFDVALGRTQWIADITYNVAAAAWSPGDGQYGVFGLSVLAVDYGDFQGTIRADNEAGFDETSTFGPSAWVVGVGYSKKLSDRFSFGAQVKLANEDLGSTIIETDGTSQENSKSNVVGDIGILYSTGFKSLTLAMTARNFANEVKYAEENFELPLMLRIGVSMDMVDFTSLAQDRHSMMLVVDAEHPRDFDEQVRVGAEYTFMDLVSLRAGYVTPSDEESFSLGAACGNDGDGHPPADQRSRSPDGTPLRWLPGGSWNPTGRRRARWTPP